MIALIITCTSSQLESSDHLIIIMLALLAITAEQHTVMQCCALQKHSDDLRKSNFSASPSVVPHLSAVLRNAHPTSDCIPADRSLLLPA